MKGKSNKKSGVNIIFLKEDESLYLVVCVLTYRIIDSVIRYTIILVESWLLIAIQFVVSKANNWDRNLFWIPAIFWAANSKHVPKTKSIAQISGLECVTNKNFIRRRRSSVWTWSTRPSSVAGTGRVADGSLWFLRLPASRRKPVPASRSPFVPRLAPGSSQSPASRSTPPASNRPACCYLESWLRPSIRSPSCSAWRYRWMSPSARSTPHLQPVLVAF